MERIMTMQEKMKFKIIKKVINKKLSKKKDSILLNLTIRRINQLIKIYYSQSRDGFIYKSRNKVSQKRTNYEIEKIIIDLYFKKYQDFNFKHFNEKLKQNENINLAYSTLHSILTTTKISSPKYHRKKRKFTSF